MNQMSELELPTEMFESLILTCDAMSIVQCPRQNVINLLDVAAGGHVVKYVIQAWYICTFTSGTCGYSFQYYILQHASQYGMNYIYAYVIHISVNFEGIF